MKKEVFEELFSINVNDHTEKKKSGSTELTYLSWPFAISEIMKRHPDMKYIVKKFENGAPYFYDSNLGYMVMTEITIDGDTREMILPVMDSHNAAMKTEPYKVVTKWSEYMVPAATMFDINKTIMRCLVKNLAMFGLGLYIYAGEDLPESEDAPASAEKKPETVEKKKPETVTKRNAEPVEKKKAEQEQKPNTDSKNNAVKADNTTDDEVVETISQSESEQFLAIIRSMFDTKDLMNKAYVHVLKNFGLNAKSLMNMKKSDYPLAMEMVMELSADDNFIKAS